MQITVLWVALGGALGSAARYWCSGLAARLSGETFPWGTLFVNVLGSLIIGFFATMTGPEGKWLVSGNTRQFVMVGVLGGFTTFSSFSLQTLALVQQGELLRAAGNVGGSVVLCLAAVWIGHVGALALHR
jgi:CrcB protein